MPAIDRFIVQWSRSLESLLTLADELTDADWALPAGCGEWSVLDVFAHLIGGERWLAVGADSGVRDGSPEDPAGWPERPVMARRGESPAATIDGLRYVYAWRLA